MPPLSAELEFREGFQMLGVSARTGRRDFLCGCALAAASYRPWCALARPPMPAEDGFNLPMPTLGGKQFWSDVRFFHDWRIQRNCFTHHHRLLDAHNIRHTWGTFEQCEARLDRIRRDRQLPAMRGRAVILLHGLFRTTGSLEALTDKVRDTGDLPLPVTYASTQAGALEHAADLHSIIEHLDGIETIDVVTHSMGSVVFRAYGRDHRDPRLRRAVLIAPPSQGAAIADYFTRAGAASIAGPALQQMRAEPFASLARTLPPPPCEFGILAGGSGNAAGYNPLLLEDNDGVVKVSETRLERASDFLVVPHLHSFIAQDPGVVDHVMRFLDEGYFVSAEAKRPIPPRPSPSP